MERPKRGRSFSSSAAPSVSIKTRDGLHLKLTEILHMKHDSNSIRSTASGSNVVSRKTTTKHMKMNKPSPIDETAESNETNDTNLIENVVFDSDKHTPKGVG